MNREIVIAGESKKEKKTEKKMNNWRRIKEGNDYSYNIK